MTPWIDRHGDGWLFRPADAEGVTRKVRDRYDRRSYAHAIRRACDRAFPHPRAGTVGASALADWRKAHRWSPLQLRHAVGTAVRGGYGVETAQAVLGHAKADTTQLYAERLDAAARAWAEEWG